MHLAERGFDVIGVDASRAMLDVTAAKVPRADFRLGDLADTPVDDASVDVAVRSLALCHVERFAPVIGELARVVRPGGTVIVSDMHPTNVAFGGAALFSTGGEAFELHFVRNLVHPVSEYIAAANAAGLVICQVSPAMVRLTSDRTGWGTAAGRTRTSVRELRAPDSLARRG